MLARTTTRPGTGRVLDPIALVGRRLELQLAIRILLQGRGPQWRDKRPPAMDGRPADTKHLGNCGIAPVVGDSVFGSHPQTV